MRLANLALEVLPCSLVSDLLLLVVVGSFSGGQDTVGCQHGDRLHVPGWGNVLR